MSVRVEGSVDTLPVDASVGAEALKALFSSKTARAIVFCAPTVLFAPGCATDPAIPTVVQVPVAVSCIRGEPLAKPETRAEEEILSMPEYSATLTVWMERLLLKAWAEKAEALLQGCK